MITHDIATAASLAQTLLRARLIKGDPITRQVIEEEIAKLVSLNGDWNGDAFKSALLADLETKFNVWIETALSLDDLSDHKPWLDTKRGAIRWSYWNRYKKYMEFAIPPGPLQRLDETTDMILERLEDPERQGLWSRRGLIVGNVQSGKTANYTGLICKAADAGYKLIIVLAGIHKNLRSQTQIRLDEGFLGYRSDSLIGGKGEVAAVGVGLLDSSLRPDTITNRTDNGDFKRAVANHFQINPGGKPLLFVVKKNASVLRNILTWVDWAAHVHEPGTGRPIVKGVPLLLIDDEADHASIDTAELELDANGNPDPDHDPNAINFCIRRLLHCFEQNSYVGYTATPFANIFIHERAETPECGPDLFPRSFIINLPAPSNYFGPERLFGEATGADALQNVVREISDRDTADSNSVQDWIPAVHKRTHVPTWMGSQTIPPSLSEAIRTFILSCAARRARGAHAKHMTMLVHVTRFTDVQGHVKRQIEEELASIVRRFRNDNDVSHVHLKDELRALWDSEFAKTQDLELEVGWDVVEEHLWPVIDAIRVKEINGSARDVLDYSDHSTNGLTAIVVGGDKLARGLTLEGLSVSYFLRASRMYDTLMQMGRWFGYRPRYEDLCRLYLPSELREWYGHITQASQELRDEFDRMVATGGTPRDYGLRVQSHPVLMVTSRVKSRASTSLQLSFSGDLCECLVYNTEARVLEKNLNVLAGLISELGDPDESPPRRARGSSKVEVWSQSRLWHKVGTDRVIGFLRGLIVHPSAYKVKPELLASFIELQSRDGTLTEWDVALIGGSGEEYCIAGTSVATARRKPRAGTTPQNARYDIQRLISQRDESIDLSEAEFAQAVRESVRLAEREASDRESKRSDAAFPSGPMLRASRPAKRGLLLAYLIQREALQQLEDHGRLPLVGFALSFPANPGSRPVSYLVNNIYYLQEAEAVA